MLPVYARHDDRLPWKPERPYVPLWLSGSSLFVLVDPVDAEWLGDVTLSVTYDKHGRKPYAVCYRRYNGGTRKFYIHKEITELEYGPPPVIYRPDLTTEVMIADHRDGDSLDCRRHNLRWLTRRQNRININGSHEEIDFENCA
jgi:hypothetical protein